MLNYILRRLLQSVFVLFAVSIFSFSLMHMADGSPARLLAPDGASDEVIAAIEHELGLDLPLHIQYINYMKNVLKGDLGVSLSYKIPINKIIAQRLPNSAALTIGTVLVGCALCIPLGIIAGSNRGKPADFFAMFFALLGNSMSAVWLGVLNVFLFSVWLGWLPSRGTGGLIYAILPALTLGYPMAAEITRVGRSGMIDTLGEDYITATYAKGISRTMVNWKYAFKNAMIPIVTLVGVSIGSYLAGAVVVETIFGWPGIGQLINQAVGNRDYPLVQSVLLVSAALFTLINLIVDIINSLIDPRVSLE